MSTGNPNKILIIRLSSIGDILLTTPLLRILRKRFPEARIDFVIKARFAELLRTNPNINELIPLDPENGQEGLLEVRRRIKATGYDLVIDIHKNFRSLYLRRAIPHVRVVTHSKQLLKRFLLIKAGLNLFHEITPMHLRYIRAVRRWGIVDDGLGLEFFLDATADRQIALRLAERDGSRLLVGMAAGAGFETKRWPAEYFLTVAKRLQIECAADILLLGNKADREITSPMAVALGSGVYDWVGTLSLQQSAAALARCHLLITNDTGLMHLACALKVPVIAIFGPTTRELGFFPVGPKAEVIENESLSCRPCTHMGSHRCPKGHFRCMQDVLPERVFQRASQILQWTGKAPK